MRVLAAALGIGLGFLPLSAIAQQPADGDGDAVAIATEWDEFAAVEDVPRPEDGAEITAPDPRIEDAISPYPMRVRLSPELDEQQRRIAAQAAQSAAGWIIDEAATHEVAPNPEFPEHLVFYEIKGASGEDWSGLVQRYSREGAMSLEEIFEFYADPLNLEVSWASNVPVPVNLGSAARPDFGTDLQQILEPISRLASLKAIADYSKDFVHLDLPEPAWLLWRGLSDADARRLERSHARSAAIPDGRNLCLGTPLHFGRLNQPEWGHHTSHVRTSGACRL